MNMLQTDRSQVLIVDIQEKFLPVIKPIEEIIANTQFLIKTAKLFNIPITITEQNPKGLGATDSRISELLPNVNPIAKMTFSCWGDEKVREKIISHDRDTIVLAGIETPVCILQTGLDLLTAGYKVYLCLDAIGARKKFDHKIAVSRLMHEGAVASTTETAIFELTQSAESEKFKEVLKMMKKR